MKKHNFFFIFKNISFDSNQHYLFAIRISAEILLRRLRIWRLTVLACLRQIWRLTTTTLLHRLLWRLTTAAALLHRLRCMRARARHDAVDDVDRILLVLLLWNARWRRATAGGLRQSGTLTPARTRLRLLWLLRMSATGRRTVQIPVQNLETRLHAVRNRRRFSTLNCRANHRSALRQTAGKLLLKLWLQRKRRLIVASAGRIQRRHDLAGVVE